MARISAHDGGARSAPPGTSTADCLRLVRDAGADFVEVDVRRTADGGFVVRHDESLELDGRWEAVDRVTWAQLCRADPNVLSYTDALSLLAGRVGVHLDLKFCSPAYDCLPEATWEVAATARALEHIAAGDLLVTTLEDRGVAAVRRWAAASYPDLVVGLSLGRSRRGQSWRDQLAGRRSELRPARLVAACDPQALVVNRWLAALGVARWAARRGLRLVVWTVDDRRGLRRWLRDQRCWLVVTNEVTVAVQERGRRDGWPGTVCPTVRSPWASAAIEASDRGFVGSLHGNRGRGTAMVPADSGRIDRMKISGTATLSAPPDAVWQALNDPAVLVRTIPGCSRLEEVGPDAYTMTVTAGVASIKGVYTGSVRITEQDPPDSFLLKAAGSGGPGTVTADVRVRLSGDGGGDGTTVSYDADAVVGGMIGGVGQRMLTGVAKKTAGEFFAAVDDVVTGRAGAAGEPAAAPGSAPAAAGTPPGAVYTAPGAEGAGVAAAGGFVAGAIVGAAAALAGALVGAWLGGRRRG